MHFIADRQTAINDTREAYRMNRMLPVPDSTFTGKIAMLEISPKANYFYLLLLTESQCAFTKLKLVHDSTAKMMTWTLNATDDIPNAFPIFGNMGIFTQRCQMITGLSSEYRVEMPSGSPTPCCACWVSVRTRPCSDGGAWGIVGPRLGFSDEDAKTKVISLVHTCMAFLCQGSHRNIGPRLLSS